MMMARGMRFLVLSSSPFNQLHLVKETVRGLPTFCPAKMFAHKLSALAALVPAVLAAQAPAFAPAAVVPTAASNNYTGVSNGTLSNSPVVSGKAFDRFIQVRLLYFRQES